MSTKRRAWRDGRWAVWLAGLVTFAVRLPLLTRPRGYVFDEVFYAADAVDLLQWGAESGRAVHPPLGKWLIAGGIRVFGFTPTGWRISSVLAGAVIAALVVATARRLGASPVLALCAGLAICLDGVMFVTSRLALLDIFVAMFLAFALWFVVVAWTSQPDRRRCRRALLAALVSAGLATGVKWSGAWIVPVVAAVAVVLDWRQVAPGRARWRAWGRTAARVVLVPLVVYAAAWLPREIGPARLTPRGFWDDHVAIARFHADLVPKNVYAASGTTWFLQTRPAALYRLDCTPAMARSVVGLCPHSSHPTEIRILAVVNPVVWAAGMAGLAALVVLIAWRRDGLAAVLVGAVGTQWLPWIINSRAAYSFYEAAVVPPVVVGAAYALSRATRPAWKWLAPAVTVGALAMFVFLYPIWTGLPLSHHAAELRRLMGSWP
ncbi:MAG TPA: phospholipid carrier-dependent glycosyltransferase [Acidimicrobiales bacterium]|jgi:dolichyl-phosphate-mannose--protein O-mannosyl transferase|nr:phospholipid carrier-dependent glycosyltransferase [Acidimicrobiales bacterium]